MDAVRFRELLNLYDFYAGQDAHRSAVHARMLEGIASLKSVPMEAIVRGAPLRGTQVELTLNEDHFAGEGEAYLFGRVLDRFLGLYATLNSFTRLTLKLSRTGMVYHFPPRLGEQIVPAEGESTDQGVRLVL
jgi:type VI secretion system protein ImpG